MPQVQVLDDIDLSELKLRLSQEKKQMLSHSMIVEYSS
jgi:hypothetical protein